MRWSLHGPIECILECMILLSAALWAAFYDGRFFFFFSWCTFSIIFWPMEGPNTTCMNIWIMEGCHDR